MPRTTFFARSGRAVLAVAAALAVSGGLLAVTASPSTATSTTTVTQTGDVFGGGPELVFTSSGAMTVPAAGIGTSGPASPFPSPIFVPYSAPIVDVTVELSITHTAPDDLDLLLVGPQGQQVLLMSDAGGGTDMNGFDLVLSDDAPFSLPDTGPVQGTTFRPANYDGGDGDPFPVPAPQVTGNTSLSVFDGTSPAGTWKLFARDDAVVDIGSIGFWSLHFNLASTPYPSTLDVGGLGAVSDVDLTLHGFTSTYPDDMDVLLVGPGGQQALVMSDAGGGTDVNDLTVTFDDEAVSAVQDAGGLGNGSFRPVNYDPASDQLGAGAPPVNGNTALSVFDGLSPNGQWRLFFHDDNVHDVSTITGWSLTFSFADTQPPTGSVTIAGGAASTSSAAVTLGLSATDPEPSSGVSQMRFSNDGTTFSAYQPYAATAAWSLAPGDGTRTVYAQFRDADGHESAVVSDSITVASTPMPPADTIGPRSLRTSPASHATGVKTSALVKVTAAEALAQGSVTGKTVLLKAKGSSHRVQAKLVYRGSSHTIVLTPGSHLRHHTTYQVTVKGVRDLAGNAWDQKPGRAGAQALTFSFTTS